jgi:hypothetical protein
MRLQILTQKQRFNSRSFRRFLMPLKKTLKNTTPLEPGGDRPFQMGFLDQAKSLIYYHLYECESGRELIQALEEEDFARTAVAPEKGIKKSSFFEAINTRGLEQLLEVYGALQSQAVSVLPREFDRLGDLRAIDGSLVDAVASMHWADYSSTAKKAKVHLSFDVNRGIPRKIVLTDGKANERSHVSSVLSPGETGIMDRGYQDYEDFDLWQEEDKHFVCRIKANAVKEVLYANEIRPGNIVFYDAVVILGAKTGKRTQKPIRVIGYHVGKKKYWVATDRHDLSADDIAFVYKLRWDIEKFFAWWKRHLRVYHLIARSEYGLMVQLLAGLITYLLLAIYCTKEHGKKVTKILVRRLRNNIRNEVATYIVKLCASIEPERIPVAQNPNARN